MRGAGPYSASAPEPSAPRVSPIIGDAVVTALPRAPVEGGALSMTNAAIALEASPHPRPCRKRPVISGVTLCTSVSTSVPAAVNPRARRATVRRPRWSESRPSTSSAAMTAMK